MSTLTLSILSNQFTLLQGDWLTIPYGDHPHSKGIQRLTPESGRAMTDRFHSMRGKLARMFGGLPFYVGHPDDPAFANESPDKRAYGWIMDMEAHDDGLAIQVKWNELGKQAISNAEYKWFSPRWAAKQIGSLNGVDLLEPQWLISVGLTNRPNIGVMSFSNEEDLNDPQSETNNETKGVSKPMKEKLLKFFGLSNEATEDQILAAATALKTSAATAESALANEKTVSAGKDSEISNQKSEIQNLKSKIGDERRARIALVLANAIAAGKITEAQKPKWATDLLAIEEPEKFDAKVTELSNAEPVVKTALKTGDLGGRNSATVSRMDKIQTLVNEKVQGGMLYDDAWAAVKKANPALFEEPKRKEG